MTRIFTNGAEVGDLLFFDVPGTATNVTTAPRSGSRHYSTASGSNIQKNITALAESYWRVPFQVPSGTPNGAIFVWRSGSTTLGSIRINSATHKLEIYTSTGTLAATGTTAIQLATWYSLEVHIKIVDGATGAIDVRLDGTSEVAYSGDTQPGSDTTIDNVQYTATGAACYFDDLAMNDTAGSVDNSWCGDGKCYYATGTSAGDVTQLTPSAGSNWQCIDEVPPNTSDYVSSAVAGNYDLYNCGTITLATGEIVRRVQVEARCLEESALGDSVKLGVKTVSTEYFDSGHVVTTAYARYVGNDLTLNPNTGAAWTQTQIDALQVGVKVV